MDRPAEPEDKALARRERERDEDGGRLISRDLADRIIAEKILANDRLSGFALGFGIAIVLGVAGVVVYLLLRKDKNGQVAGGLLGQGVSPITIINQMPAMPMAAPVAMPTVEKAKKEKDELPGSSNVVSTDTNMRTVRLAPGTPFRVATAASSNSWRVTVRPQGPAGSWAIFGTDPNALTQGAATVGADVMIVPNGQESKIVLGPRQVLYGIGSVTGVATSVITSEMLPLAVVR